MVGNGKLRNAFEADLMCTFARGSLTFVQYGIKVMFCGRVYYNVVDCFMEIHVVLEQECTSV